MLTKKKIMSNDDDLYEYDFLLNNSTAKYSQPPRLYMPRIKMQ